MHDSLERQLQRIGVHTWTDTAKGIYRRMPGTGMVQTLDEFGVRLESVPLFQCVVAQRTFSTSVVPPPHFEGTTLAIEQDTYVNFPGNIAWYETRFFDHETLCSASYYSYPPEHEGPHSLTRLRQDAADDLQVLAPFIRSANGWEEYISLLKNIAGEKSSA